MLINAVAYILIASLIMEEFNHHSQICEQHLTPVSQAKTQTLQILVELKMNSFIRPKTLADIIQDWKIQAYGFVKHTDVTIVSSNSSLDQKENVIQQLLTKIQYLEHKMKELTTKHIYICVAFSKEIQKKNQNNQYLKKQNNQLNKELKSMMDDVRKIASKLYDKEEARVINKRGSAYAKPSLKNKQNQQNSNLGPIQNQSKLVINVHSPDQKMHAANMPRTENKPRLKTFSDITFDEQNQYQTELDQYKIKKIKHDYYFSEIPKRNSNSAHKNFKKNLNSIFSRSKSRKNLYQECNYK